MMMITTIIFGNFLLIKSGASCSLLASEKHSEFGRLFLMSLIVWLGITWQTQPDFLMKVRRSNPVLVPGKVPFRSWFLEEKIGSKMAF